MATQQQSPAARQAERGHGCFDEHSNSTQLLGPSEVDDLQVLRTSPQESTRFGETVNKFVMRGLKQHAQQNEGYSAAISYFFELAVDMENKRGFSPEQAAKVHDLMVNGWQKHVAMSLGQTLRSPERLVAVLDDVINYAEHIGGAQPPAMMQLALHSALQNLECEVPPTPFSQPERTPQQAASLSSAPGLGESLFVQGGSAEAEMEDAAPAPAAQPAQPTPANDTEPAHSTALSRFFMFHAMKAKKAARQGSWHASDREVAKSAANAEWAKMDMRTRAEWEDLFRRSDGGDRSLCASRATAHLFQDGIATCTWSNNNPSSPVAESSKLRRRKPAEPEPIRPAKVCLREANFEPTRQDYHKLFQPERITFLIDESDKPSHANHVAKACIAALQSLHGTDINTSHSRKQFLGRNLFVMQWDDIQTARKFQGATIRITGLRPRVAAYPTHAPQIFVAHMNHLGDTGIEPQAVHRSLATVAPKIPFHLRREEIGSSRDTVWIAVFREPPQLLRFTVGIQNKSEEHVVVAFEPLMRSAPCPVCHAAHSAVECGVLVKPTRKDLRVRKGCGSYLEEMPELK